MTSTPRSGSNFYTRKEDPFYSLDGLFDLASFEKSFVPKIDVKETKKDIQVAAEIPGMDEKDIDVSLHEGSLIMKGEKKNEHEDKKDGYVERSYGSFYRAIAFPDGIDEEKVEAHYKKGVLKIVIPKTEKKQKKIEVKVPNSPGNYKL